MTSLPISREPASCRKTEEDTAMAPGILVQSVLFVAIFIGIAVIRERDLGILQKHPAGPTPRAALVLGKALSAGVRGISQAAVIYSISLLMGVKTSVHFTALAVMLNVSKGHCLGINILSCPKCRDGAVLIPWPDFKKRVSAKG